MKTNNLWPSNFVCFFLMLKENKNIFVDPKASWAWGTVTSVHQWSQPWVPGSLTAHLPLCLLKMPTWFAPQNLCPGSAPWEWGALAWSSAAHVRWNAILHECLIMNLCFKQLFSSTGQHFMPSLFQSTYHTLTALVYSKNHLLFFFFQERQDPWGWGDNLFWSYSLSSSLCSWMSPILQRWSVKFLVYSEMFSVYRWSVYLSLCLLYISIFLKDTNKFIPHLFFLCFFSLKKFFDCYYLGLVLFVLVSSFPFPSNVFLVLVL